MRDLIRQLHGLELDAERVRLEPLAFKDSNVQERAEATCSSSGSRDGPSHQLVNMPAANDERAFEHVTKYLAGLFTAFGILQ